MTNATKKLEEHFYSLEISETKDFVEWINEQPIVKEEMYQYDLESSYIIFSRIFRVENDIYEIFRTHTFDWENGEKSKLDTTDIRLLEEYEETVKAYRVK